MIIAILAIVALLLPQGKNTFYVSPSGSPNGNGSISRPWDLRTAFNHPATVRPGDTVCMKAGVYPGIFVSRLTGTAANPIVFRSCPGEWARVDGGSNVTNDVINVNGRFTRYMEFEVLRSGFKRYINRVGCGVDRMGIDVNAGDNKFINLVIHDTSLGIGGFQDAPNTELYGNLLYYNGWVEVDATGRGCDHGFYGQNVTGSKKIYDNISFYNFATGITPHGTNTVYLNNFDIEGNVLFNNGMIRLLRPSPPMAGRNFWFSNCCPTTKPAQNLRYVQNYSYYPNDVSGAGSFYLLSSTSGAEIRENRFMGGGMQITGWPHPGLLFVDNTILANTLTGFSPGVFPQNTYLSQRPSVNEIILRQNAYNPDRAHLIIYNWELLDEVTVNVEAIGWEPDAHVELRPALDYFNGATPIIAHDGQLRIPMTGWSVVKPVDWPTPPTTFPEFGAFVLTRR